jgi:hypothetical protein
MGHTASCRHRNKPQNQENPMKRALLAVAAVFAVSGSAAANTNCAIDYKSFWDQFSGGPAKQLSAEQHAMVSRNALRAFDACTAGDESSAKSIFARLRDAAPAKGEDYWKQLSQTSPAKQ